MMSGEIDRRTFLRYVGAAGLLSGLAGCVGVDGITPREEVALDVILKRALSKLGEDYLGGLASLSQKGTWTPGSLEWTNGVREANLVRYVGVVSELEERSRGLNTAMDGYLKWVFAIYANLVENGKPVKLSDDATGNLAETAKQIAEFRQFLTPEMREAFFEAYEKLGRVQTSSLDINEGVARLRESAENHIGLLQATLKPLSWVGVSEGLYEKTKKQKALLLSASLWMMRFKKQ